jgi:hypothetical protein
LTFPGRWVTLIQGITLLSQVRLLNIATTFLILYSSIFNSRNASSKSDAFGAWQQNLSPDAMSRRIRAPRSCEGPWKISATQGSDARVTTPLKLAGDPLSIPTSTDGRCSACGRRERSEGKRGMEIPGAEVGRPCRAAR